MLEKEKKKANVLALERGLSMYSYKTNSAAKYADYLKEKARVDEQTRSFYRDEKWRKWKFRLYCYRKSSEDRLLNRIAENYGPNCRIFYGDWSRKTQMKGCAPSPTVGIRNIIAKRFNVVGVDEYKTSITCNTCKNQLDRYRNQRGKLSYSRLYCKTCGLHQNRTKWFVDRDVNAAHNILLIGTSTE